MIRVVIAEDHHLVRDGIRALLERAEDIEVVGEATEWCRGGRTGRPEMAPDVIVMDVTMPEQNGIEATRIIRDSDVVDRGGDPLHAHRGCAGPEGSASRAQRRTC